MKICIYGVGAIGGFIGTRLAGHGCHVTAIARGATAEALLKHGWRLQSADKLTIVPALVAEHPESAGPQDVVVIAVKGPALVSVAAAIAPLLKPESIVLTAMNGIPWWFFQEFGGRWQGTPLESVDPGGRIAAAIPAHHIVGCVVHVACSAPEPGLTLHSVGKRLILGEPRGGKSERVEALGALLHESGFDVEISHCIQSDIWYKLWGNMTMNPVSAMTGATADRVLDDPLVNEFCKSVMREAAAIGARIGCPIEQSADERNAVTRRLGAFKTSMLQDVGARKPVEIDVLLSAVREIGALVGEPTPQLDALLGLARLHARTHGLYAG